MAKKKPECGRYDNILVSERTKSGMSLNVNDIKFMIRLISTQDDYNEEFIVTEIKKRDEELTSQLAQTLGEQLKGINSSLTAIASDINDIRNEIVKINKRLDATDEKILENEKRIIALERFASWQQTAIRISLAVAISLLAYFAINYWSNGWFH